MAFVQHFRSQPMAVLPSKQNILLLHEVGQRYQIESNGEIPTPSHGDLLIEIHAIGLNPIDWKSATYGFGIPQLPCVNGREFVGRVAISENNQQGGWQLGDWVLGISTDYRDFKKSAFQEFAIVRVHNAIRIPPSIGNPLATAAVGVAYVTAALSLGVCLGVGFSRKGSTSHQTLLEIAQQDPSDLPLDVEPEIIPGIGHDYSPRPGDWIMIYGASSVTAQIAIQLSKLAGLKVVGVANLEKHRQLLESLGTGMISMLLRKK
ncbi:zinc-binding dehydrogenase [Fusarium longipes]|uniref:Zinc-binding dehydrogenase n=1 Tax=Fusarium longipes TaxID=694270 RepID=A0A395TA59_9HYPO|nr:zinc-binding dehydrogenase [Fusarium longipes]